MIFSSNNHQLSTQTVRKKQAPAPDRHHMLALKCCCLDSEPRARSLQPCLNGIYRKWNFFFLRRAFSWFTFSLAIVGKMILIFHVCVGWLLHVFHAFLALFWARWRFLCFINFLFFFFTSVNFSVSFCWCLARVEMLNAKLKLKPSKLSFIQLFFWRSMKNL